MSGNFEVCPCGTLQRLAAGLSIKAQSMIGHWLDEDMDRAVANGANSISMPDELIEIALWLHALTLTQQQSEPVAWMQESTGCIRSDWGFDKTGYVPVYTAPPKRKPLTDEELQKVLYSVATSIDAFSIVMTHWPLVARATEAAHGIKEKA